MLKLVKFPSPSPFGFGGVFTFYYTSHVMKRFIPHVHYPASRPMDGFENGSNLAGIRIEYFVLMWEQSFVVSTRRRSSAIKVL